MLLDHLCFATLETLHFYAFMLSCVVIAFDSIFWYFKITFIVIYIFLVGLLARVTVIARSVSRQGHFYVYQSSDDSSSDVKFTDSSAPSSAPLLPK